MSVRASAWSILLGLLALAPTALARAERGPAPGRRAGDVSPSSFAQLCRGELPEARRVAFFAALESAEAALSRRAAQEADAALDEAFEAAYRGGPDSDVSVKCLGQEPARRWLEARLELDRQRAAADPDGSASQRARLHVTAADRGFEALVTLVAGLPPRRFAASLRTLAELEERVERQRRFGAFVLPAEQRVAEACRAALPPLRERAARAHQAALAAEAELFDRPATEPERAAARSVVEGGALVEAVVGAGGDAAAEQAAWLLLQRVEPSLELLRTARLWDLDASGEVSGLPSSQRARERGEALRALANDAKHGLRVRDGLYAAAIRYFEFGGFDAEAMAAVSARAAIQPALQAEQLRQRGALDQAMDEMLENAQSAAEAAESAHKSESEKRRFEEEAEALEAELGF